MWSYDEISPTSSPILGSVAPIQVRSGNKIAVEGVSFGASQDQVLVGGRSAPIIDWTDTRIVAVIPPGIRHGLTNVTVRISSFSSNNYSVRILSDIQVPVTFTLTNISNTNKHVDDIYLTGDVFELGEWSTDPKTAQGPMYSTCGREANCTKWLYTVSLPGCWTVEFRYFHINRRTKIFHWEPVKMNHRYTVPCTGVGKVIF